jgi:hypothetical protein
LYLNFDTPLSTKGQSGTASGYEFSAPSLKLSSNPDSFGDARLGADVRVVGAAQSFFRLGLGAQLFFPTGKRFDYDSDDTYRGMARALFAGDIGAFSYAAQLGAHIRPRNDTSIPDAPRGSELLFGAAGGFALPLDTTGTAAFVAGPEVFGETAFNAFLGSRTTGVEGLLTARLDTTSDRGAIVRFKLGAGGGLDPNFGAPDWRIVCAFELSDSSLRGENP